VNKRYRKIKCRIKKHTKLVCKYAIPNFVTTQWNAWFSFALALELVPTEAFCRVPMMSILYYEKTIFSGVAMHHVHLHHMAINQCSVIFSIKHIQEKFHCCLLYHLVTLLHGSYEKSSRQRGRPTKTR
jgi:hypothetical protein